MRGRKGRLAKLLSVPVLAICGFAAAATLAGVGLATTSTSTSTTTPTTTTPTTTTTTPPGGEGYDPGDLVGDVFEEVTGDLADLTLLEGLRLRGGGENALLRHGIAALLGAANDEVDYPLTEQVVINMVNEAFESGDFEATKDLLDESNNLGSPGFCD